MWHILIVFLYTCYRDIDIIFGILTRKLFKNQDVSVLSVSQKMNKKLMPFYSKKILKTDHMLLQSGEKSHKCKTCGKVLGSAVLQIDVLVKNSVLISAKH